jgi:hypothetical protein
MDFLGLTEREVPPYPCDLLGREAELPEPSPLRQVQNRFTIESWSPRSSGTYHGTASVVMAGLRIEIAILAGKNGLFALLPAKKWTKSDGTVKYTKLVEFVDRDEGARFSEALLSHLRRLDPNLPR